MRSRSPRRVARTAKLFPRTASPKISTPVATTSSSRSQGRRWTSETDCTPNTRASTSAAPGSGVSR